MGNASSELCRLPSVFISEWSDYSEIEQSDWLEEHGKASANQQALFQRSWFAQRTLNLAQKNVFRGLSLTDKKESRWHSH